MQQYFVNENLKINETISLDEDIVFHLTKVLRNTENYFRLVDKNHNVFLAELSNNKGHILKQIDENNELDYDITALISIIKQDKFEIILQKLTELGVKRIVPITTSYSQNLIFSNNKLTRFHKIIKEAAEQSHRNIIPELCSTTRLEDIHKYKSELNIVAYENEKDCDISFKSKSISFIIGPEGGFKKEEIEYLINNGFKSISIGKTILRAETAAINLASNIIWENK